jgi:hypothetical protein
MISTQFVLSKDTVMREDRLSIVNSYYQALGDKDLTVAGRYYMPMFSVLAL